jgi:hypothetical protein
MSATDYLEGRLLNHVLRNTAFPQPTALYMALHTADPGEGGTANEVVGGGYAAQVIVFGPQAGSVATSTTNVNFTSMPACSPSHFSIRDAVTGGNALYSGQLSAVIAVTIGATLPFPAGTVSVNCD